MLSEGFRMEQNQLNTLVAKISKMEEILNKIQIQLAGLVQAETTHKENVKQLVVRCDENRTKIVDLEVQVTAINTKLMIFGVLATIIVPIITGFLMKVVFHNH